jgi:uncharacterized integral membrane protein
MWRFIKVLLAAFIIFIIFNFLLTNLGPQALGYRINFQFNIPPILYLQSASFPVGILILIAFCLGMIFAAFTGAISVFHRSREIKAKNRTIRELEREIEELRALYAAQRREESVSGVFSEPSSLSQETPDEPRVE